jgi:hypothetical protein
MKINRKKVFWVLGTIVAIYVAFLVKKSFIDQGYPSEEVEKEIMLGKYVISLGLENTKSNRDKYKNMTLDEIYKALGIELSNEPVQ